MVSMRVRGPGGVELDVDSIVDSGYTASLTLPMTIANSLGLVRQSGSAAVLADGTVHQFDVYSAEVEWDGAWRAVLVSVIGSESRLGMRLVAGHKLTIEVIPGGSVEILPLS
jgi:predicted aspartyl protease